MDNAPGPSIDKEDLLLTVKPNPIITEVQENSRIYTIGSEESITIIVRTLYKPNLTSAFKSLLNTGKVFGHSRDD